MKEIDPILVEKYKEKIIGALDIEYYKSMQNPAQNLVNNSFSEVRVEGLEKFVMGTTHNLMINTHRSTFDEIIPHVEFLKRYEIAFRSVGGINLKIPGVTSPIFGMELACDIERAGLIGLDKTLSKQRDDKGNAYREGYLQALSTLDTTRSPIWFAYTEGRTKTGYIPEALMGTANRIIMPRIKKGESVTIYPITLDYDRVPEDIYFPTNTSTIDYWKSLLKKVNKEYKHIGKTIGGYINAIKDTYSIFIEAPREKTKGAAYLTIGKPIEVDYLDYLTIEKPTEVNHLDSKLTVQKIINKVRDVHLQNTTITAPMIFSYCNKNKIDIQQVIDIVRGNNNRIGVNCENAKAVTEYTKELLEGRDVKDYYVNYGAQVIEPLITKFK